MRSIAKAVSVVALAGTLLPPLLFFTDRISLDSLKLWLLLATIVWFLATPLWMDRPTDD